MKLNFSCDFNSDGFGLEYFFAMDSAVDHIDAYWDCEEHRYLI